MEQMMTLREVCEITGVTRRAIQGYEKAGLLKPSGKTERGYLLYNASTRERVKQIKLYQQLGFTVKEIGEIIDAPDKIRNVALEEKINKLKIRKKELEQLIDKEEELIKGC